MKILSRPFLSLLIGFSLLSACSPEKDTDTQANSSDPHAEHSAAASTDAASTDAADPHANHLSIEPGAPSDQSLYLLDNKWNTHTGKKVELKEFAGKPVVMAMVYSSCKNACPRIIVDMKKIQAESEVKHPGQTRFVLVTMDPEVDTPAKLAELSQKSQLDQQWDLLQGSSDDVMALAAVLGVKYRKISETDYAHSNLITVLNSKGEIAHRQMGLDVEPAETLKALDTLY